jgi:hypothetical protein
VYLGLVLVGTPQAIAQQGAAMTRNFDVRDEIEFCDELDKKPKDQNSEESLSSFDHESAEFISAYFRTLLSHAIQGYSEARSQGYEFSVKMDSSGGDGFVDLYPDLSKKFFAELAALRINGDGFYSKLSIKPRLGQRDVDHLYSDVAAELRSLQLSRQLPSTRLLVSHTSVSRFNDQVFVITYLPRGSLDEHLAKDAK